VGCMVPLPSLTTRMPLLLLLEGASGAMSAAPTPAACRAAVFMWDESCYRY
jgi:hypothetical protein